MSSIPRAFFRTCRVHFCFSQDRNEPQPDHCKCRKMVSTEQASGLVNTGVASWLIDYSGEMPKPTWDVVLNNRMLKTPRAQTIEKAHMERYTEHLFNRVPDLDDSEIMEHYLQYHDTEIESRIKLFRIVGADLLKIKRDSDEHGNLVGEAGRVLVEKIVDQAEAMKALVAVDDPFYGRAIFNPLGGDQRTFNGK